MKRCIVALLCLAVLLMPIRNISHAGIGPAILVVVTAVVAASVIVWVYANDGSTKKRCLVLYKGYMDGQWTPVATNIMIIGPYFTRAFPCFADQMTDSVAFYKIAEIPMPEHFAPSPATNGGTWAFVYP